MLSLLIQAGYEGGEIAIMIVTFIIRMNYQRKHFIVYIYIFVLTNKEVDFTN